MKRDYHCRLYSKHDADLLDIFQQGDYDICRVTRECLAAFARGEAYVYDVPRILTTDPLGKKIRDFKFTTEDTGTIQLLDGIRESYRNLFIKNVLRLYLCIPGPSSFFNYYGNKNYNNPMREGRRIMPLKKDPDKPKSYSITDAEYAEYQFLKSQQRRMIREQTTAEYDMSLAGDGLNNLAPMPEYNSEMPIKSPSIPNLPDIPDPPKKDDKKEVKQESEEKIEKKAEHSAEIPKEDAPVQLEISNLPENGSEDTVELELDQDVELDDELAELMGLTEGGI